MPPDAPNRVEPAKSKLAEKTAWFEERLGDTMPVFRTFIRDAQKATEDSRENGFAVAELQQFREEVEIPWWKAAQTGEKAHSFAGNTADVAGDYTRLAEEMIRRQIKATSTNDREHANV